MFANHNQAIYDYLGAHGLMQREQLDAVSEKARVAGQSLADALVEEGLFKRDVLLEKLSEYCGCEFLSDGPAALPGEALAELPAGLARSYGVIPLRADARRIELLAADPFNLQAVDDLTFALGR